MSSAGLNPELLPPGTLVGPWRVMEWAGRGVHGAVYRAIRADEPNALPVALKIALLPGDPRFAREAEQLSRQHHPNIPRMVDHGNWEHPSGTLHPYIAMEWVDGVPLYDWARLYHGNVLVRRSDSRAFLMDFGSCRYADAATLTPQLLPPGTPAYRSPEAWLFSV